MVAVASKAQTMIDKRSLAGMDRSTARQPFYPRGRNVCSVAYHYPSNDEPAQLNEEKHREYHVHLDTRRPVAPQTGYMDLTVRWLSSRWRSVKEGGWTHTVQDDAAQGDRSEGYEDDRAFRAHNVCSHQECDWA